MNEALWDVDAMATAMHARPLGDLPATISGISIDTRTLEAGDAFFAIQGDRFDGHDFLTAATKAGAALHVVSEQKLPALGRVGTLDLRRVRGSGEGGRITTEDVQAYVRDVDPESLRGVIETQTGDTYNANKVENTLEAMTLELANGVMYPEVGQIDYFGNRIDATTGTMEARALIPTAHLTPDHPDRLL